MSKKWTTEEARSYITKVQKGKLPVGLTYCSALDFIMNHTNMQIDKHPLMVKEGEDDDSFGVTG